MRQELMNGASGAAMAASQPMSPEEQQAAMPPEQAQPQGQAGPPKPRQATEREEEEHMQMYGAALQIIYNPTASKAALEMLKADPNDPAIGLAEVASRTMEILLRRLKDKGKVFGENVMTQTAVDVFEEYAEMASKKDIHDFVSDKKGTERAFLIYMDTLRQTLMASGAISQQKAKEAMGEVVQMDKAGKLGPFLQDLAAFDQEQATRQQPGGTGGIGAEQQEEPPMGGLGGA